ncbi:YhgE/Pip domain-containing protein [Streptomyces sp. NPDC057293]|uniref:YhgE/Pip domain-containing protein n=1 Tax=Streptomyces TaxID=1883 RepID=UPI00363EC6E3
MTSEDSGQRQPLARAFAVARHTRLWLVPTVLCALVALFLTLLYMGGILNPNGNLHRLPIALVNTDQGPPLPGQQQTLGAQVSRSVVASTPADSVQWRRLSKGQMQDQLASGKVYGALVIPADFTTSVAKLTTPQASTRPALTVLTNPGLGTLGSSLASQITQRAAHQASLTIGRQLTARASGQGAEATTRALLGDPIGVTTRVGHPVGRHSGLGLTAFYVTLLLVLTGFVGGNIINSGVDAGLGYTDNEIGPWHTRRPTVPISRTQTLLLKMLMTAGITVLTTSLLMIAAITILGMDASHLPLLWIFSYCASLAVGLGVQAINAAFGAIGQVVSMFVFIALALPSSGATIPLHAVPGFYRFLALFEPMRQLSDGVRSILYFDARADAGLTRGWSMIAIGVALALLFGFAMTLYYDRKGLHRLPTRPATPPGDAP